jgi:hypothetical protein
MLTLDHVRTMRVLMARAPLKGDEVPAFNDLNNALDQLERLLSASPPAPEGGAGVT